MKTEQIDRIQSNYPKAFSHLEDFLYERMSTDKVGMQEIEKLEKQFGDGKKASARILLAMGERFLYEYFDPQKIYVFVSASRIVGEFDTDWEGTEVAWHTTIPGEMGESDIYKTRQEAETAAFTRAFQILEEKLG